MAHNFTTVDKIEMELAKTLKSQGLFISPFEYAGIKSKMKFEQDNAALGRYLAEEFIDDEFAWTIYKRNEPQVVERGYNLWDYSKLVNISRLRHRNHFAKPKRPEKRKDILTDYLNGESFTYIMYKYQCSAKYIASILKKNKVEVNEIIDDVKAIQILGKYYNPLKY